MDKDPELLAAGRLAMAAEMVVRSNAFSISQRIKKLQEELDNYNIEILKEHDKKSV